MHNDEKSSLPDPRPIQPRSVELLDPQRDETWDSYDAYAHRLRSRKRLAAFLFLTTCVSTFLVGMEPGVGLLNPFMVVQLPWPILSTLLLNGLKYSGAIMMILLAHEMGHYLQARRYGIPATLPYFIPMPIVPFGTMGAVIVQGAGMADRKVLFDIAISGPLAGLVLALPVAYMGVLQADVAQLPPNAAGLVYGDPLILKWMVELVHGPLADNEEVLLNPLLFAGWVGIFVTALNLIPIGQLDGGHILYTLIGRKAHVVAISLLGLAIGYMFYSGYPAYALMIVLLILMGPRHPPTANDRAPLGRGRVILGWLTLAFVIVGFTPKPLVELQPERPAPPAREPAQLIQKEQISDRGIESVMHHRMKPAAESVTGFQEESMVGIGKGPPQINKAARNSMLGNSARPLFFAL